MDAPTDPTDAAPDCSADITPGTTKKKARRGNKGRPKAATNDEHLLGMDSLADAARQLAASQVQLVEAAIGPQSSAKPSTSSESNGVVSREEASTELETLLGRLDVNADGSEWKDIESQLKVIVKSKPKKSSKSVVGKPSSTEVVEIPKLNPDETQSSGTADTAPQEQSETPVVKNKKKKKSNSKKDKASQPAASSSEIPKSEPEVQTPVKPEDGENSKVELDAAAASEPQDAPAKRRGGRGGKKVTKNKKAPGETATGEQGGSAALPEQPPRGTKNKRTVASEGQCGSGVAKTPSEGARKNRQTPSGGNSAASTSAQNRRKPQSSPRKSRGSNESAKNEAFPDYWSEEQVQQGIDSGTVLKGVIRINKKNFREAYINSPGGGKDILLEGIRARNRALEGDEVAVHLLPQEHWKKSNAQSQRTGEVVRIVEVVHHRQAVGTLKPLPDKNSVWALFSPRDSRVPRVNVPASSCPPNFANLPDMLYLAEIKEWKDQRFALGTLVSIVGMAGTVEVETKSILMENGLDTEPYGPEMAQYFPAQPYTIPREEINKRDDFRELCIFTIDPATARDLDDAVSYRALPGGEAEVGVHISDVSFFLQEGTPLDDMVCSRATTTYMVQSVFHMLPVELCRLCSLTPGEDKLAFSVVWRVSKEGEFLEPRFCRSVINSCCQMAYEQAQAIMDAPADTEWSAEHVPQLHGNTTPRQVAETILALQPLARTLRAGRFTNGALRIDQPKLSFGLDRETGLPDGFSVYQNMECHRLIEELMLLANMAVARQLHTHVPDLALLRCHAPPHDHMLPELQALLAHNDIHLDISSSQAIHASLQQYLGHEDREQVARGWALSSMLAKPMTRARYFCAQGTAQEDQWHYALSVPLYTHFTSPIRRYADVVVHRLLAATLGLAPMPEWHPDMVHKVASNCNGKKYSAKRAGEQSGELYLTLYVGMRGPLREEAVVVDVKDHSFDVLVLRTGSTHRVYTNNLDGKVAEAAHRQLARNVWEAEVRWKEPGGGAETQLVKLFSLVTVELAKDKKELRINAKLCKPAHT